MRLALLFTVLLGSIAFSSCELDKDEPIPAFLKLDTLRSDLDYETQGSNSNNFTEAWVYVDGGLVGVYDMPALFPVLETGNRTVMIRPGIKRDGITISRVDHPHFANLEFPNQNLKIGDTLNLAPQFKLRSAINVWYEDFEDAGFQFENAANADTSLVQGTDTNHVYEGNASGYAYLEGENETFSIFTKENFAFRFGVPIFLEFDYKIDAFLRISLITHTPGQPDVGRLALFVAPKRNSAGEAVWNKIYINLSDEVSSEPNASSYDIRIEGFQDFGQTNSSFWLDNIKILYPN